MRLERAKATLLRLLHPSAACTALLASLSFVLLLCIFLHGLDMTVLGFAAYGLSTYTLAVLAIKTPAGVKAVRELVLKNQLAGRLLTDIPFRIRLSLYASLGLNLAYALFKLAAGIYYESPWFGVASAYYGILSVVRFLLLRQVRSSKRGLGREYRQYRFCGCLLVVLTLPLAAMVSMIVRHGAGYQYPGVLIYAMAAFVFVNLTVSIVNFARFRKWNSPIYSAAKALNLATSLVALLCLQTAMFAEFGESVEIQQLMNTLAGGGVCLGILAIAIRMVLRGNNGVKDAAAGFTHSPGSIEKA